MKTLKLVLAILLGAFLIYGGINHFINPVFYEPFMPDFFPKDLANYASGIVEIILGLGIIIPKYRKQASMGIIILMIIFLPLHIWDLFKEEPAIGSKTAAWIRIPFQFVFIAWAWWLGKGEKKT